VRITLEDKDGFPWTASTGIGWIILIVVFTSGTAALALGLYLALWIRSKGRSALPLYGYAFVLISIPLCFALEHVALSATALDVISTAVAIVWLISAFALRHEIIGHYKKSEGWDIAIGPFFTLLFSVAYINYCLNPLTVDHRAKELTSLNLGAGTNPPK
jgi:hypothetical protein